MLYGSIARGDGIYEPETAKGYVSDYDILVIVNQDELAEPGYWAELVDRFSRDHVILDRLRHPVSLIVHTRSEEHTSELQSLMRISYAVFCLKKKNNPNQNNHPNTDQHLLS